VTGKWLSQSLAKCLFVQLNSTVNAEVREDPIFRNRDPNVKRIKKVCDTNSARIENSKSPVKMPL